MSKWFPDRHGSGVSGRFIEIEVVDPLKSAEQQRSVTKWVAALESRIPGHTDISVQRVKPHNEKDLIANFPGAWDWYQAHREEREDEKVVRIESFPKGTPLDRADFIPREKVRLLADQGFCTVEDLAKMSDAVKQIIGRGASKMQKDAAAFLART